MQLLIPQSLKDYTLIDSGNGERLERFGEYIVRRPDPQCLWLPSSGELVWNKVDAKYSRSGEGDKGSWVFYNKIPPRWKMEWERTKFWVEPTPFKHVGVFPEQAAHWEWMREKIVQSPQPIKVLNLFGYTGIASVVCSDAGAKVTHVDASKPSITWAKENMLLSGLPENSIRWILEDVLTFVKREIRRGNSYDAIIMDPPVFGHGVDGEVWKFGEKFPELMRLCAELLSVNPQFVIVNAYAVSMSAIMLQNVLEDFLKKFGGAVSCGELALQQENGRLLSTGIFGRWQTEK